MSRLLLEFSVACYDSNWDIEGNGFGPQKRGHWNVVFDCMKYLMFQVLIDPQIKTKVSFYWYNAQFVRMMHTKNWDWFVSERISDSP